MDDVVLFRRVLARSRLWIKELQLA